MVEGTIEIAASVETYDPTDDCTFDVVISKGTIKTHLYFYGHTETWKEFGQQLVAFPQHIKDHPTFVIGADESSAPLLALTAYCYDAQGHAALKIMTDNNEADPYSCRLEFSITAEIASINRLGEALLNWRVEDDTSIVWQACTS